MPPSRQPRRRNPRRACRSVQPRRLLESRMPRAPGASAGRWSQPLASALRSGDGLAMVTLLAGVLVLYLPTYWDFLFGYWAQETQGHELLVIAVSGWLVW